MSKGGSRQADGAHLRTKGKTVVFVIAQRYCFDKLQANQRVDGNMLVNEKLIQDPLYSFKLRAIQWIKNPQLDWEFDMRWPTDRLIHLPQIDPCAIACPSVKAVTVRGSSSFKKCGQSFPRYIRDWLCLCCSAQEQQIWEIISREILNLSLNAKFCISQNMAPFLYVFRTGPCS